MPGRIVSIGQPHDRPIVRGKAGTPAEVGATFSVSVVDGYVFLVRLSWENDTKPMTWLTTLSGTGNGSGIILNLFM